MNPKLLTRLVADLKNTTTTLLTSTTDLPMDACARIGAKTAVEFQKLIKAETED